MELRFGYGTGEQRVRLPEKNLLACLMANPIPPGLRGAAAVVDALAHPVGCPRLREQVRPGQKIIIISSDISRPMPTAEVLPPVLAELEAAGVRREDVTLVLALGSHRRHTQEEIRRLAGDCYDRIRCVDSDPEDCVLLGTTTRGTPVEITRVVAEADFRICLGNIEFHYFAGYSGGAKAIMPGVSTPAAIQCNHRLMTDPAARVGNLAGNPIREDLEEAERFCPAGHIVNVVLDEHKRIVYAVAGDVIAAHRAGCAFLDRMYRKPIPAQADVVLVSQGGAPKDANLYQTQKALENAKFAVKPGGTVILIGACSEGLGSRTFEEWLLSAETPHALVERIGRKFQLGGHKAAAIAMVLERARVDLVSQLPDALVRRIFLTPQPSAQAALDAAWARCGSDATVIAMPYGGATLPQVTAE